MGGCEGKKGNLGRSAPLDFLEFQFPFLDGALRVGQQLVVVAVHCLLVRPTVSLGLHALRRSSVPAADTTTVDLVSAVSR